VAWSAAHQPTSHKIEALYSDGERDVQLYVVLFPNQRQGSEAINQDNRIAVDLVKETSLGQRTVKAAGGEFPIRLSKAIIGVAGKNREYLVGRWYRVAGRSLVNRYEGKAWEALARLYPGRGDGAWIAVATPIEGEDRQSAERHLVDFATHISPAIDERIDRALGILD
jgi:EpsI family protein